MAASVKIVASALRSRFTSEVGVVLLHKLLYYSQGWHIVWAHEPMFPEPIEAWDNGPVVATLWRSERSDVGVTRPVEGSVTDLEARTLDYVVARYGHLSGSQLIGETHQEDPWRDAYRIRRNTRISPQALGEFFSRDPGASQAWFWSPDWQHGEREADVDIAEGNVATSYSDSEFLTALDASSGDL